VALTSFFFTFFKVFLNGLLTHLSRQSHRLMNGLGADKLFFHFFQSFFERPKTRNLRQSVRSFWPRITRMPANKNRQKSARIFVCQRKAIVTRSLRDLRENRLEIHGWPTL
jgi:hypothetical protein